MQCPSQIVFLVLAWRHDLVLRALRHPRCSDLWQEVNIELIRKHHDFMRLQVFVMKPNARQTLAPVWVIIFGHQLGPFPHPAHLVEPAAHGFCGHLNAVFGLERRREGGTTPPGAAPAIGAWGGFEYGAQGAHEPGHQDGHPHGDGELTVWVDHVCRDSQRDTPARYGTRWSASKTRKPQSPSDSGPPHTAVRCGTPADSHTVCGGEPHASGLALLGVSPVRLLTAQWGLLETSMWVNIQRITGVPHCANVVWPDLDEAAVAEKTSLTLHMCQHDSSGICQWSGFF